MKAVNGIFLFRYVLSVFTVFFSEKVTMVCNLCCQQFVGINKSKTVLFVSFINKLHANFVEMFFLSRYKAFWERAYSIFYERLNFLLCVLVFISILLHLLTDACNVMIDFLWSEVNVNSFLSDFKKSYMLVTLSDFKGTKR